ncbi:MAG: cbb3-type cytochrome c oxidase subunit 3 [Bacteroidetes bacterium]|nr:cbb3-type cytochrome c oxidase subunit 3 [Bacteroidota bacterium]MBK9413508.1 cbb3-type cytochrome c oxidase subunit 3 [Bacteroidota bacterium]MBP6426136.1 cbb3-type cytochrome c oxidase subunit 3 [Bacteroidia bacterium]MBP6657852.1 cbb3-type cytochrome c oxidase subunit 3 [Bacteroidia bacterium]
MFKNYFKGIEGIATYPMFSLLVFFIFFMAVFIWALRTKNSSLEEVSRIPLESENNNNPNSIL